MGFEAWVGGLLVGLALGAAVGYTLAKLGV